MATIVDAINDAITLTKRPDKRGEAILLANQAIAKFVRRTTWPFDRMETIISFDDPSQNIQTILLKDLIMFRKMNYLRQSTSNGVYFTMRDPASIVTNCGAEILPSYYIAGDKIVLKDYHPIASVKIGYFKTPPRLVTNPTSADETNTHWSLDIAYNAIVYAIMAEIFAATGDDKSYGIYENKWQTEAQFVLRDFGDHK